MKLVPIPDEVSKLEVGPLPIDAYKVICHASRSGDGNVVEIGCGRGSVTRIIAKFAKVYAVDWTSNPNTGGQAPTKFTLCCEARCLDNVTVLDMNPVGLIYEALDNVKTIIINGDRNYQELKEISQKAIRHLRKRGGFVLWNASDDVRKSVDRYLQSEIDPIFCEDLYRFEETWITMLWL